MTRILLVGSGGREHALAWRFIRDEPGVDLIAAPGNPGINALARRCVSVPTSDIEGLVSLAAAERVDAVVVGPEAPLAAGLADRLRERHIGVFGPNAAAAMLETSKSFAKDVMREAGVPTGRASTHTHLDSAMRAIRELGAPVVIKATGLAAGKGVIVCESIEDAQRAATSMLEEHALGDAGSEILVEEFLTGEELSLFVLTDGERAVALPAAQDHKRLLEGDKGPNTGGMGAYAPVSIGTADVVARAMREVVDPTLAIMRERGTPFSGLLYAGLMLTADGPKVIEFNCRFGDPETQAVLPILDGSLLESVMAIASGAGLTSAPPVAWNGQYAVTTVVAATGYPGKVRTGDAISIRDFTDDVLVFHAGTERHADGHIVTAGGRVLALTAVADSFTKACQISRSAAGAIEFSGKQYRRDIGWREQARSA